MPTDLEKKYVIYKKLLNMVEDNYLVRHVCDCLVEVLAEISTSDEMNQLVSDINNKSKNLSENLHNMLHEESSENLTKLFNFVQLV